MNRSAYAQQVDRQLRREYRGSPPGDSGHVPRVPLRGVLHKSCSRCGRLKPADREHFQRDGSTWDGHKSACKDCCREGS